MIDIGIVGSTGLVGETLIKVLLGHPEINLTFLGSEHAAGKTIQTQIPSLAGAIEMSLEKPTIDRLIEVTDVVFLASKTPEVMTLVPPLLDAGKKVIDLGAEFRLKKQADYEKWYKAKHLCPDLLAQAVYGLPELHRNLIRKANLIANPGCYATTAILALIPFLELKIVKQDPILIDAFSGLSGAGRTFNGSNLHVQVNETVWGYKLGQHRHSPEMEQALSQIADDKKRVVFLPHVIPMNRGIYCTCFFDVEPKIDSLEAIEILQKRYEDEFFVRVYQDPNQINIQNIIDTNFCDISVYADPHSSKVMVFSVTDNMVKGAAGQAIQNMNLMFGLDETLGLKNRRMF